MARIILILAIVLGEIAAAQIVEVKDNEKSAIQTGTERAKEYFKGRKPASDTRSAYRRPAAEGGNAYPRYLALHVGTFFDDQSYRWGNGNQSDDAKLNLGVTYRIGEWINSADFLIRMEYTSYSLDEDNARKISFGGLLTFPDANSRFPLYFGAGLGAGVFIKQLDNESALSLDYSLVAGARFFDVIENLGFMFELGLKNHLLILSDGQFNGVFWNVGTVFAF
jgi:hypothetical protein